MRPKTQVHLLSTPQFRCTKVKPPIPTTCTPSLSEKYLFPTSTSRNQVSEGIYGADFLGPLDPPRQCWDNGEPTKNCHHIGGFSSFLGQIVPKIPRFPFMHHTFGLHVAKKWLVHHARRVGARKWGRKGNLPRSPPPKFDYVESGGSCLLRSHRSWVSIPAPAVGPHPRTNLPPACSRLPSGKGTAAHLS